MAAFENSPNHSPIILWTNTYPLKSWTHLRATVILLRLVIRNSLVRILSGAGHFLSVSSVVVLIKVPPWAAKILAFFRNGCLAVQLSAKQSHLNDIFIWWQLRNSFSALDFLNSIQFYFDWEKAANSNASSEVKSTKFENLYQFLCCLMY